MKLHLVQKAKWYDMVESGEKQEEYRDNTPFWRKRIGIVMPDSVVFHRAYTATTMEFKVKDIVLGIGRKEWGFEGKSPKIIIVLGDRIK